MKRFILQCCNRTGSVQSQKRIRRVERVEVPSRTDVLAGKRFGEAGTYEKLSGKVHFAVKPVARTRSLGAAARSGTFLTK